MDTVIIPKTEYSKLKRQSDAYKKIYSRFFEIIIKDPKEDVIKEFQKTNLYTREFLTDLEDGLKKSSYAKK